MFATINAALLDGSMTLNAPVRDNEILPIPSINFDEGREKGEEEWAKEENARRLSGQGSAARNMTCNCDACRSQGQQFGSNGRSASGRDDEPLVPPAINWDELAGGRR